MTILSLMIINRDGGVILQRDFVQNRSLKSNDWMRFAGLFWGACRVSKGLCPVKVKNRLSGGISEIVSDGFRLSSFHTLTGLKFIVTADNSTTGESCRRFLRDTYRLYQDNSTTGESCRRFLRDTYR